MYTFPNSKRRTSVTWRRTLRATLSTKLGMSVVRITLCSSDKGLASLITLRQGCSAGMRIRSKSPRRDETIGNRFIEAMGGEERSHLLDRRQRPAQPPLQAGAHRQSGLDLVVPVDPGDLLDEVGFPFDIARNEGTCTFIDAASLSSSTPKPSPRRIRLISAGERSTPSIPATRFTRSLILGGWGNSVAVLRSCP